MDFALRIAAIVIGCRRRAIGRASYLTADGCGALGSGRMVVAGFIRWPDLLDRSPYRDNGSLVALRFDATARSQCGCPNVTCTVGGVDQRGVHLAEVKDDIRLITFRALTGALF